MKKNCENCKINRRVSNSKEPACCKWYLENIVIKGKSVKDCPDYEPIKKKFIHNKK